jgi:hypothetical protein
VAEQALRDKRRIAAGLITFTVILLLLGPVATMVTYTYVVRDGADAVHFISDAARSEDVAALVGRLPESARNMIENAIDRLPRNIDELMIAMEGHEGSSRARPPRLFRPLPHSSDIRSCGSRARTSSPSSSPSSRSSARRRTSEGEFATRTFELRFWHALSVRRARLTVGSVRTVRYRRRQRRAHAHTARNTHAATKTNDRLAHSAVRSDPCGLRDAASFSRSDHCHGTTHCAAGDGSCAIFIHEVSGRRRAAPLEQPLEVGERNAQVLIQCRPPRRS